jgi:hypothetical protein
MLSKALPGLRCFRVVPVRPVATVVGEWRGNG